MIKKSNLLKELVEQDFIIIVGFDIPVNIYYGFKKAFGHSNRQILNFWVPKIIVSSLIIATVWLDYRVLTSGLLLIHLFHLIILQWQDIVQIFGFMKKRLWPKLSNEL